MAKASALLQSHRLPVLSVLRNRGYHRPYWFVLVAIFALPMALFNPQVPQLDAQVY